MKTNTALRNVLYQSTPAMASQVVVMSEEEKQLVKKLRKVEKKSGKDEIYNTTNEQV